MSYIYKTKSWVKKTTLFPYFQKFYISLKRGKLRLIFHWLVRGHILRYLRIYKWLKTNQERYLQVGGGRHIIIGNQWLNGDLIAGDVYLNAAKKLPFPDRCVDAIFTEQFIEHLTQEEAIHFLSESYRILKPGGIIRQSTPELEKIIALYLDQNEFVSLQNAIDRHIHNHRKNIPYIKENACQFVNDMFRLWGHRFIYDKNTFQRITEDAGFREIKWVSFGESEVSHLKNLERHADVEWMKNSFVMACEAQKTNSL